MTRTMTRTIPEDMSGSGRSTSRPVLIVLAAGAGALAAATAALWAHYGTAVFYETIVAGINACF
jgi:hypothetical protein